jgi:transglutaminase-like putative cysteine protease
MAACLALCGRVTGAAPGDVKTSFEAPCKYPAGLASDGTDLFVVDWRDAKIHQISATDGKVIRTLPAPTLKPYGLAYGDGKLFVSDDHSGWVYALNASTGIVENSFEAPGPRPTGLAYGDGSLFILERKSGQISKVTPDDGTILAYLATPNDTCTCLTYDGKYLWASDRVKNEIYVIEPDKGMVVGILDAPGPYTAGLARVGAYLWNVDFQTRTIYQIILRDEQKYRLSEPREARVEYVWALYNYGPGEVKELVASFALPERLPNQELLSAPDFAAPPTKTAKDHWGQTCAVYEVPTLAAGQRQVLSYSVQAKVSAIRYLIFPHEVGTLRDIPDDIRKTYTADGSRYRLSTPFIQDTVRKVVGDEQNAYWVARKIYGYVIDKLEYEMVGGWDIPEVVLQRGKGSCSEYTFAFIALCRAAGLPARYEGSIVVRGDDASVDEAFHRWAQVYLPNYGWVPVDANKGDAKSPADQARGFGELSNRFLITTHGGGDSEYLWWGYNAYAKCKTTGYAKVEEDNFGLWEPLKAADPPPPAGEAKAASECKRP